MKGFETLEHPADLKIRAFGKNKKELFLNTMVGMYTGARYESEGREIKREIQISSLDSSALLVDFLSELLYLTETNKEVYHRIQFQKFNNQDLQGTLIGKKLQKIGVLIKGATYHQLQIHQREDGIWEATILFDI